MTEERKLEFVTEAIYKNQLSSLAEIRAMLYSDKDWKFMIDSEPNIKMKILSQQYCPYCLRELEVRVTKVRHGDATEPYLTEYFNTFCCPIGCDLD